MGSPPPTRGTLTTNTLGAVALGITPAYAGNTKMNGYTIMAEKDHPRLRGEHFFLTYWS